MKPIIPLGLAAALLASPSFAVSPICGFYGGLLAEVSYAPSTELHFPSITTVPVEITYDILGGGGGQLGYRISNNFRAEVQGLFNSNKFNEIQINNVVIPRNISSNPNVLLSMTGRTNVMAGFINAYYDFLTPAKDCNFAPYLGLGIGYVSLRNSLTFYESGVKVTQRSPSATESGSGAQGIVGFSYFMDDYTWASMDYRYISTNKISTLNDKRFELHTLNFTINFSFEGIKGG